MFVSLGMLVPIILHLWNIQRGKILKVGSVALLAKDTTIRNSNIKLHDLLLLLLRCLFILFLAMLLCRPQWKNKSTKKTGWVLIDKARAQQTYNHFKPQVDSLLQAGYQLHYFNNGFEKTNLQTVIATEKDSGEIVPYWDVLRQLIKKTGTQMPLYIFSSNYLRNFSGNRPSAPAVVHWFTYSPADTLKLTMNAYITAADSARQVAVTSAATGTYNMYYDVAKTLLPGAVIDTSTLYITIYAKEFAADIQYIKAAINAVQQFSKRKIQLSVCNNAGQVAAMQHWLFWLSTSALPTNVQAKNIFRYQGGKTESVQSLVTVHDAQALNINLPGLYNRVSAQAGNNAGYETLWVDGFGQPLLQKEAGQTNTYHFYSRFDAAWNDMPWNNDFAGMMYALLFDDALVPAAKDNRIIDDRQLQPSRVNNSDGAEQNMHASTDISAVFWAFAFAIFFMERIISSRVKKGGVYA
jgi:hypothetical protein